MNDNLILDVMRTNDPREYKRYFYAGERQRFLNSRQPRMSNKKVVQAGPKTKRRKSRRARQR